MAAFPAITLYLQWIATNVVLKDVGAFYHQCISQYHGDKSVF